MDRACQGPTQWGHRVTSCRMLLVRQESWASGEDIIRKKFPVLFIRCYRLNRLGAINLVMGKRPGSGRRHRFRAKTL